MTYTQILPEARDTTTEERTAPRLSRRGVLKASTAAAAAVVAGPLVAGTASARQNAVTETYTLDAGELGLMVTCPAPGEFLYGELTFHDTTVFTENRNGGYNFKYSSHGHGTLVSDSGTKYVYNDRIFESGTVNAAQTYEFTNQGVLVSQGEAPNEKLLSSHRLTITPDGEVVVNHSRRFGEGGIECTNGT